jgi:DNA-binding IclR family transcriptional regulator
VDRAISILQVLARTGPNGVSSLAEELGIHKSTVFRLLSTLEARGLVAQAVSRGEYQLGAGVVDLAAGVVRRHDIAALSRGVCEELAVKVGETVNTAVRDGNELVTLDQVMGRSSITTVIWTGQRQPLHVTAGGMVFLSAMTSEEFESYLAGDLVGFTEKTIVDPAALHAEIDRVREVGYAYTFDELEPGLAAIGAPIRALDGSIEAAVALTGPTFRVNAETLPELVGPLLEAAAAISVRNGYPLQG